MINILQHIPAFTGFYSSLEQ